MKNLIQGLGLLALIAAFVPAQSKAMEIPALKLAQIEVLAHSMNLIDWKVGEREEYKVSMGFMGGGTMVHEVTKDEGEAIWTKQTVNIMSQNQVVETLIRKADGKILKLIQNGQEQQVPDDQPEIISQDYTTITVPAGTFQCIHVVANTKQAKNIELWANPTATVMDGMLKMKTPLMNGALTMELELTKFVKVGN